MRRIKLGRFGGGWQGKKGRGGKRRGMWWADLLTMMIVDDRGGADRSPMRHSFPPRPVGVFQDR